MKASFAAGSQYLRRRAPLYSSGCYLNDPSGRLLRNLLPRAAMATISGEDFATLAGALVLNTLKAQRWELDVNRKIYCGYTPDLLFSTEEDGSWRWN
jgi:hypothetical protein